jgi:CYTH domain-containing protein
MDARQALEMRQAEAEAALEAVRHRLEWLSGLFERECREGSRLALVIDEISAELSALPPERVS